MNAAKRRRGWCPGALRPMQSGDGYLVRLRITGGIVSAAAAKAIARCAEDYGNGLIDLSGRANLQLRGVSEDSLPDLIAGLQVHGLIDDSTQAESVRNVMASPLAGFAPDAMLDIRALVSALEQRLASDIALHALPSKFGFLVDDGGTPSLSDAVADIRFTAFHGQKAPQFAVNFAGCKEAAVITPDNLVDVAAHLAVAFLTLSRQCEPQLRRMSHLVEKLGSEAIWQSAGLVPTTSVSTDSAHPLPLGHHALGRSGWLGIAAPFGRWSARSLSWLADAAVTYGSGELRLTPWRAILLPGVAAGASQDILSDEGARFITDPSDPRLSVIACPGAPACASGTTQTHEDALALAPLARALTPTGLSLHVSGCDKACARPVATTVTLVARDGLYDLIVAGRASDRPSMHNLDLDACRTALRAMASSEGERP